ncbi:MAG: hypothetical protein V3571_08980 [Pseudodesulfovibrio sp.]
MLLAFPYMHAYLFPENLVPSVRFLDPGMAEEPEPEAFRPEGLPLDRKTAIALINDCIRFGEQFKDPAEMAYFGALTADDYYEGSPMSIQAQLQQRFADGQGGGEVRERREALARAQFILLLAWFFEERMLELQGLEQKVKNTWEAMDQKLGVDAEDRLEPGVVRLGEAHSHTGGASGGQEVRLPWQRIVEALPAFIVEDTVLVCVDSEIYSTWDDLDIRFDKADASLGLPEGALVARQPAWRFSGRRREPANQPLACREVTVAVVR